MRLHFNSFTAGELSPILEARTDIPGLGRGCRKARNWMPWVTGGVQRRPGTKYRWTSRYSSTRTAALVPFVFSNSDALILEFGHQYIRFGSEGDLVESGGSAYQLAAEWTEDEVFEHKYVQVNDVMYLAHPSRAPWRLTRNANDDWSLESLHDMIEEGDVANGNLWPALLDENATSTTLACSSTAAGTTNADLVASADLFDDLHIGAFFELAHRRETAFDELTIPVYPPASEIMTVTGLPSAGETFTVNGRPYTWRAVATQPYEVLVPSAAEDVVPRMVAAINATSGSSAYGPGTAPHPDVEASDAGSTAAATSATGILTSNGNPDLTSGAPNFKITIGTGGDQREYRIDTNPQATGSSTTACDVRQAATAEGTLLNLLKAINLSGVGDGSDYHSNGGNFTVHPTVSASVLNANQLLITAKTGGTAGNSIPTTVSSWSSAASVVNRLKFGATTLKGGTAGAAYKLKIEARDTGSTGNDITVAETQSNASWIGTALTGGTDIDTQTEGILILGSFKVYSYGTWQGTVFLEAQRPDETWEVLTQWTGQNDRNVAGETFTAERQTRYRLRLVDGAGTSSADEDIPRFVIEAGDARLYGLVRITDVTDAQNAKCTVCRDLFSTDATTGWSEGAWSDYQGWPSAVAIHDQRLVFMGTTAKPQNIWFSATGDFHNFRRGTADSDGFVRELAANESSPIVYGVSLGQGIIIGKESSEWLGTSTDGQASVTPVNFNARTQSSYGTSNVQPVISGSRLIFVKSGGRALCEYLYAFDTQEFAAVELNELSNHLTRGRIRQLAYQRRPEPILWVVTEDGKLLSMHYRREKEFIAWAWHEMSGTVESVACIPGENSLDDVYLLVNRTIGGSTARYVEKIDGQTMLELEEDDIDDADQRALLTYLDCSVYQTGAASATWSGFDHLEGELIAVMADGLYHAPVRVLGGSITLSAAATKVLGGIDYSDDSPLIPMPVDFAGGDGTTAGKKWRAAEIALHLYRTAAARYADDEDSTFRDVKIRETGDDTSLPIPAFTGKKVLAGRPKHQDDVRVCLKPSGGEPMNVLALIVGAEISG